MKTLKLAVAALALVAAVPALALRQTSAITTGAWSPTKASARVAVTSYSTSPISITTGTWAPTKPTVRATGGNAMSTVLSSGPGSPTKPSALHVATR